MTQVQSENATTFALGDIDQIAPGQGRCFVAAGRQIAIFRMRSGALFALDNLCPHRGGPLAEGLVGIDYASHREAVVCPLHALKFCLRDGSGLDSRHAVRSYPVELRGGVIHVTVA